MITWAPCDLGCSDSLYRCSYCKSRMSLNLSDLDLKVKVRGYLKIMWTNSPIFHIGMFILRSDNGIFALCGLTNLSVLFMKCSVRRVYRRVAKTPPMADVYVTSLPLFSSDLLIPGSHVTTVVEDFVHRSAAWCCNQFRPFSLCLWWYGLYGYSGRGWQPLPKPCCNSLFWFLLFLFSLFTVSSKLHIL